MAKFRHIPTTKAGWINFDLDNLYAKYNELGEEMQAKIDRLTSYYSIRRKRIIEKIKELEEKRDGKKEDKKGGN